MSEVLDDVVTLSEFWLEKAKAAGLARYEYAAQRNIPHGGMLPRTHAGDIVGAVGECGTAKHFKLPWYPSAIDRGDVGPFEVRARDIRSGTDLAIRPKDKDDKPYILVHVMPDYSMRLIGWKYGREGKNGGPWNETKGVWFVPPPYRPIRDLWAFLK